MVRTDLGKQQANAGSRSEPIPFIGCASQRLNLAEKSNYESDDDESRAAGELINSVQEIMKKLRSLKLRSHLREKTELSPVIRNKTRWSSTASMIFRYLEFEALRAIPYHADEGLKKIALSNPQINVLQELASLFNDLEVSTRYL